MHYFYKTTEPPSDDSDSDSDDEELQNFSDMVNCVKKQCGSNFQCIINELSKKHTSEYIAKVENSTKGQHENELWFKHRQGRITASLAHSVLKCNLEKLKPENYIVCSIKVILYLFLLQQLNMEKIWKKLPTVCMLQK